MFTNYSDGICLKMWNTQMDFIKARVYNITRCKKCGATAAFAVALFLFIEAFRLSAASLSLSTAALCGMKRENSAFVKRKLWFCVTF